MKYLLPLLIVFTFIQKPATAQSVYFRGGLGYAFSQGGLIYSPIYSSGFRRLYMGTGSYNSNTADPNNSSENFNLKKGSMTQGVRGTLAIGLMLTDHIGVEIATDLGLTTQKQETSLNDNDGQVTTSLNVVQQADLPITVSPSLVLQTGGKINVYARGGLAIPVKATIVENFDYIEDTYNPATQQTVRTGTLSIEEEYRMRLTPGFTGAMGVQFKPVKKLTVFAEVNILSMTLYYKESELVSVVQDGVNVMSAISPSQRTTKYEFDGYVNGTENVSPTTQIPFSNVGITAGVVLKLK